jgi:hypothetical protein
MPEDSSLCTPPRRTPWNKGKLIGPSLHYGQAKLGRSEPD